MKLERQIVEFPGPDGANLVGILSLPPPDVPNKSSLVILSHGGLSHKIGAHRAQYQLAQFFVARGYTVFRFDPWGVGDSDGALPDTSRQDLFGNIESGLFKASYRAAFDYLGPRFADYRWFLSGVCGGAVSSLLAGVESPHPITAYALISCPVVMDGSRFDYSRREPVATAMKSLKVSAAKIASPRAILRFLTLRSDYKWLWKNARSILLRSKDKIASKLPFAKKAADQNDGKPGSDKPPIGLSPIFVTAARQAMKKSSILFIYGDNDGFLWEFTDMFAAAHLTDAQRDRVLRIIAHANHMFIWPEWQQRAFELIETWISTEVPTRKSSSSSATMKAVGGTADGRP